MSKVKIKEIIKEILEKYQDMDKYFRDIIEKLYTEELSAEEYKLFDLEKIIKKSRNDYSELKSLEGKTGCYIFIEEDIPVYVGVGGIRKSQDLAGRIKQECRAYVKKECFSCEYSKDSGATLSKKIQEIDGSSADASLEKIKEFQLITIVIGERDKRYDRYKAQALEAILIALFDPEYNKQVGDKNGKND